MKRIILIFCALLLAGTASAETGFQLGIPNMNLPDDPNVSGMRVSLFWGKNTATRGFDLGLLSLSESSSFSGFGVIGGVSKISGDMDGGVVISLVNYHEGRDSGINAAFINLLNNPDGAFNTGFVTIAKGETMVDLGGVNVSKKSAVQIGFVNVTKELKTFQLGFINMADNGFLPIFPFFNFPKQTP